MVVIPTIKTTSYEHVSFQNELWDYGHSRQVMDLADRLFSAQSLQAQQVESRDGGSDFLPVTERSMEETVSFWPCRLCTWLWWRAQAFGRSHRLCVAPLLELISQASDRWWTPGFLSALILSNSSRCLLPCGLIPCHLSWGSLLIFSQSQPKLQRLGCPFNFFIVNLSKILKILESIWYLLTADTRVPIRTGVTLTIQGPCLFMG